MLAYNAGADSPHSRRLTMSRLTHLSAFAVDSLVIGFNFTIVIINSAADNFQPNISGVLKSPPVQLNLHQPAGAAVSHPCRF